MSIYISASSIADFVKCPKKVEYRIKKPFPEVKTKEMVMGTIAHFVIEKAWEDRSTAVALLEKEMETNKIARPDRATLAFYIDMFFLNFQSNLRKDDMIEYSFKFPLHDDVFLVGKIDRISNGNLFDWKTGAKLPKNLTNNIQCMIYDFAYRTLFKKDPASVCLASLSDGKLIPFIRNEQFYRELFTSVIPRMVKVMKTDSFEKTGIFNQGCYRCQFKDGCLGGSANSVQE